MNISRRLFIRDGVATVTIGLAAPAFLAATVAPLAQSPQALLDALLVRVTTAPLDSAPRQALMSYLAAAGSWTGGDEQLNTRAAGLARLLVGSAEYQLV